MKIVQQAKVVEETEYELFFHAKYGTYGTGYSFRCNQFGMIYASNYYGLLTREAMNNYKRCWFHSDYHKPVIESYPNRYIVPAIGICDICDEKVVLDDPFLSPCDSCGTDYNGIGQRLAPRQYWGEETGEHPADIIFSIYNPGEDW